MVAVVRGRGGGVACSTIVRWTKFPPDSWGKIHKSGKTALPTNSNLRCLYAVLSSVKECWSHFVIPNLYRGMVHAVRRIPHLFLLLGWRDHLARECFA